ncbi:MULTISPECIES: HP1 family phage holin [Xenorhabdus]|uniref:HP1 family phage holin n=1 Tax=Xenorhabdus TaxID=626 RepID=UPI00064A3763|nr:MULTISPECIES: HP1 family phage holin [Xenorhabdus]KLU14802.1 bacteriophage protein [Xenorhabdus griffiniae]KOP31917.1 bacteriophage protein [Xenorhabdus sp. GDc328]
MTTDDKYSHATYGISGLIAFFTGLSLYEWGFLIGVFASILLGTLTYLLNRREQKKRTQILQHILERSASPETLSEIISHSPKDV